MFANETIRKIGCDLPDAQSIINCLRTKPTGEMFMSKGDWPTNQTIPPLAPDMPWG